MILLAVLGGLAVSAEPRPWMLRDMTTAWGDYRGQGDGQVVIVEENGKEKRLPLADLQQADQRYVVDREAAAILPAVTPPWAAGYRIRYLLRLAGDPLTETSRTVIASLPTGGWLKPDASDLLVQTASGAVLPSQVLSHDPRGQTVVQFVRRGMDRWYWVSAVNPAPRPQVDPALKAALESAVKARDGALLEKMTTQKASAEAAEKVRELTDRLNRERATAAGAAKEAASWETLVPDRRTAIARAEEAESGLTSAVARAEAGLAAAKVAAGAKQAAVAEATKALEAAKRAAAAAAETAGKLASAAQTAMDAGQSMQKAGEAEGARLAAEQAVARAQAALEAAEQAALPVRVEAARAQTELDTAVKAAADNRAAQAAARNALDQAGQALQAARALKAKAEAEAAGLEPGLPALQRAAEAARTASAAAVAKAERLAEAHRRLGEEADPAVHREGLTAEFREWRGERLDELSDWAVVVKGLETSANVLGNAIVTEVAQNGNPFRPDDPRDFAVSYRGTLVVTNPGVYRFFVNGDDAAFLFINGFKVHSRIGSNVPARGKIPLYSVGADIELEAGLHPFEIHQVVGHTPGAQGLCAFLWLPPGSKEWRFVPTAAFRKSGLATVAAIESQDGNPVPTVEWGLDDALGAGGVSLFLVRLEASGASPRQACAWTLGDGLTAAGRSLTHVYFKEGDVEVSVQGNPAVPPFRRRIRVATPAVATSPLSLGRAVEALSRWDPGRLDAVRLNAGFDFLLRCGQTNRWPALDRFAAALLAKPGADPKQAVLLLTARMEARARLGYGAEALAMTDKALAAAGKAPSLRADVLFCAAEINRRILRDLARASALYEQIVEEFQRTRIPRVRQAAAAWGDLYLEQEDLARAGECYRLAASLGEAAAGEGGAEATTRGSLLRVAEQQLRGGNIRQTWRLLERLEREFPEQKIEGLYRFLKAEADREGGRYDEAAAHYEVLLKLRQWAAFRPRAMQGLADCHFRAGDVRQALAWYGRLAEAFPEAAAEPRIAPLRKLAEARLAREEADRAAGRPAAAGGAVVEPFNRSVPVPAPGLFRFRPTLGLDGADTCYFDYVPDSSTQGWGGGVSNVASRVYWAEFWYRNAATPPAQWVNPHIHVRLYGSDQVLSDVQTVAPERSYGEWRKAAVRLKAPLTPDAAWSLAFVYLNGIHEIDGLRLLPVTDAQEDALRTFIEGEAP
jgi:tetratricopeptide (TPR) repeat protein